MRDWLRDRLRKLLAWLEGKLLPAGWDDLSALPDDGEPYRDSLVGAPARSPRWPAVRAAHLRAFPACEACGGSDRVEVHHLMPFHSHPELELEPRNLLTLCVSGPGGMSCHLVIGHGGDWRARNPRAPLDAAWLRSVIEGRVG